MPRDNSCIFLVRATLHIHTSTMLYSQTANIWIDGQSQIYDLTSSLAAWKWCEKEYLNQMRSWRSKETRNCSFKVTFGYWYVPACAAATCPSLETLAWEGCPSPWDASTSIYVANSVNCSYSLVVISLGTWYDNGDPPWGFCCYLLLGRMEFGVKMEK